MKGPLAVAALAVSLGIGGSWGLVWGGYEAKGRRDPFVPLLMENGERIHPPGFDEEVGTEMVDLTLQGIVFDPLAESYAVINGEILRQNDRIGDVQILKITPNAVTIWANGKSQELVVQPTTEEEAQTSP